MSSTNGSMGDWSEGFLGEFESPKNQDYVEIGAVPKRPKRPALLSSEGDSGRSLTSKSCKCADVCLSRDQDAGAGNNAQKEVKAKSNHSKEGATSDDLEYISSEHDEGRTRSLPSQRSTDHSKSFSQIYSEIFEESVERQQKAERACRAYYISRSKLQGTRERSVSRGRESGTYSSLGSDFSNDLGKRSEEYGNQSRKGFDCKAIAEDQLSHFVGCQKKKLSNTIRSSFKRLPSSKNMDEMDAHLESFECSLNRSQCDGRKLEYRQADLKKYYKDKGYYDEYSANPYGLRSSFSPRECSVCNESSVYCKTESTDDRDCLTYCRSGSGTGNPTDVTSSRRSQGEYNPRSSTRHSDNHYRRLGCVPKTYQDRGNSPINIKTRRLTNESQNLHIDMDTEKERDSSIGRSTISVGVQYPSDEEEQDSTEELRNDISDSEYMNSRPKTYCKENDVLSFTQLVRNVYDADLEMKDTSENGIISCEPEVTSDEETPRQPSQYIFDVGHTKPDGFNTGEEFTDACSESITSHFEQQSSNERVDFTYEYDRNVNRSEVTVELDQIDSETVGESSDDPRTRYEEEEISSTLLGLNEISDDYNLKIKPKNSLSLRIYNADEALMDIPEGFQGSAVILDDDADFLDIKLTDDEEHIRAKLMAAALTTRTSAPSSSANTSRKSRRSTDSTSSISSYKPSVIFSRRSGIEESKPPRNDRVSLLAERVLRACTSPSTDSSKWQRSATPRTNWKPLEQGQFSKLAASILNDREKPPDGALQLLSKEFNRKLQSQIKEIAETFH